MDWILTVKCSNRPGIVAAVATVLASHGGDITDAQQFDDLEACVFFMRIAFRLEIDIEVFKRDFLVHVDGFGMEWKLRRAD